MPRPSPKALQEILDSLSGWARKTDVPVKPKRGTTQQVLKDLHESIATRMKQDAEAVRWREKRPPSKPRERIPKGPGPMSKILREMPEPITQDLYTAGESAAQLKELRRMATLLDALGGPDTVETVYVPLKKLTAEGGSFSNAEDWVLVHKTLKEAVELVRASPNKYDLAAGKTAVTRRAYFEPGKEKPVVEKMTSRSAIPAARRVEKEELKEKIVAAGGQVKPTGKKAKLMQSKEGQLWLEVKDIPGAIAWWRSVMKAQRGRYPLKGTVDEFFVSKLKEYRKDPWKFAKRPEHARMITKFQEYLKADGTGLAGAGAGLYNFRDLAEEE